MAGVKVETAQIVSLLQSPAGPVWRDVQRRGNRVLNEARRRCPVDEGRLRSSLTMEMQQVQKYPAAVIGTNLPYGLYVHEGTGIYGPRRTPITPKRARVLRWPVKNNQYKQTGGNRRYAGGRTAAYAYARSVKGVPPRPFLRDALQAAR